MITVLDVDAKKKEDNTRTLYLFNDLFLVIKYFDKERTKGELTVKQPLFGLMLKASDGDLPIVNIGQRPKSTGTPLTSKESAFKIALQFKDDDTKRKFLEIWQVAQRSKGEISNHSPEFFKLDNTPEGGLKREESQKESKTGSIREVEFPREQTPLPADGGFFFFLLGFFLPALLLFFLLSFLKTQSNFIVDVC